MNTLQNTIAQITKITSNIESNYPELYVVLEETPLTIPTEEQLEISTEIMEEYLDSLQQILKQYIKNH
jgi:hypothetical protein